MNGKWKQWGKPIIRVGEATNPGPPGDKHIKKTPLTILSYNPTAILGKEEICVQLDHAIHFVAETSATQQAQDICTAKLRAHDHKVIWSPPVRPYSKGISATRGVAGGTAILAPYPIHKALQRLPVELEQSTRITIAYVQYAPHHTMFCAAIYGPPASYAHSDPAAILNLNFNAAAQQAVRFNGPAIISGDFTTPVEKTQAWRDLKTKGWFDAGELSAIVNNHQLEPTCHDATRHSFILCSPQLKGAFKECRTKKKYHFAAHPVLRAEFDIETLLQPTLVWYLPRSFDQHLSDQQLADQRAQERLRRSHIKIQRACAERDTETLAEVWTSITEDVLSHAAVYPDGEQVRITKRYQGRARAGLKMQTRQIPKNRKPRDGEYQPCTDQTSVSLRRHLKQVHRLQALTRQLKAIEQNYTEQARNQSKTLWDKIISAKGHKPDFTQWIFDHCADHVPDCPHREYVEHVAQQYQAWHRNNEQDAYLLKTKMRQIELDEDLEKGGALIYKKIREPPLPPIQAIQCVTEAKVKRQRWPKDGRNVIALDPDHNIKEGAQVDFQGQQATVLKTSANAVQLDQRLALRSSDMKITQTTCTAQPQEMHQMLKASWAKLFNRESPEVTDQQWQHALRKIQDLEEQQPFEMKGVTADDLKEAMATTKKASARGAEGFTTKDLCKMPTVLWQHIATILNLIEQGAPWPRAWVIARTLCWPKTSETRQALEIRPITILGKIYRVWAKVRGKQITIHLASKVPNIIGGPCKGISSE